MRTRVAMMNRWFAGGSMLRPQYYRYNVPNSTPNTVSERASATGNSDPFSTWQQRNCARTKNLPPSLHAKGCAPSRNSTSETTRKGRCGEAASKIEGGRNPHIIKLLCQRAPASSIFPKVKWSTQSNKTVINVQLVFKVQRIVLTNPTRNEEKIPPYTEPQEIQHSVFHRHTVHPNLNSIPNIGPTIRIVVIECCPEGVRRICHPNKSTEPTKQWRKVRERRRKNVLLGRSSVKSTFHNAVRTKPNEKQKRRTSRKF